MVTNTIDMIFILNFLCDYCCWKILLTTAISCGSTCHHR